MLCDELQDFRTDILTQRPSHVDSLSNAALWTLYEALEAYKIRSRWEPIGVRGWWRYESRISILASFKTDCSVWESDGWTVNLATSWGLASNASGVPSLLFDAPTQFCIIHDIVLSKRMWWVQCFSRSVNLVKLFSLHKPPHSGLLSSNSIKINGF